MTTRILERAELLRLDVTRKLNPGTKTEKGRFLTPLAVARLLASFFGECPPVVRLPDPGA